MHRAKEAIDVRLDVAKHRIKGVKPQPGRILDAWPFRSPGAVRRGERAENGSHRAPGFGRAESVAEEISDVPVPILGGCDAGGAARRR